MRETLVKIAGTNHVVNLKNHMFYFNVIFLFNEVQDNHSLHMNKFKAVIYIF